MAARRPSNTTSAKGQTIMSPIEPPQAAEPSNLVELCRHQRFEDPRDISDQEVPPARPDRIEVSDPARWMAEMRKLPSIREELVKRIRAQLNDGTYDVAGKLDAAVERMIDDYLIGDAA